MSAMDERHDGGATSRTRRDLERNNAWLRRARRHYAGLIRKWVESDTDAKAFRARLWLAAEAAKRHGIYSAKSAERQVMFGLLSKWRDADGMSWWPWMHADKRRASVADWSIKSAWIRDDAERERRTA